MPNPVEVTVKYATTVDDLPAAWTFVMRHLDGGVGADPRIEITPYWKMSVAPDGEETMTRVFSVAVEGTKDWPPRDE